MQACLLKWWVVETWYSQDAKYIHLNFESPYLETDVTSLCTIKFWTNFMFTVKLYIQYLMRYDVFKQVEVGGFRPPHLNFESPYLETYVTWLCTIKFWTNLIFTVKLYIQYLMRYNVLSRLRLTVSDHHTLISKALTWKLMWHVCTQLNSEQIHIYS